MLCIYIVLVLLFRRFRPASDDSCRAGAVDSRRIPRTIYHPNCLVDAINDWFDHADGELRRKLNFAD